MEAASLVVPGPPGPIIPGRERTRGLWERTENTPETERRSKFVRAGTRIPSGRFRHAAKILRLGRRPHAEKPREPFQMALRDP